MDAGVLGEDCGLLDADCGGEADDVGVVELTIIRIRYLTATRIVMVEIAQLHVEDSSLDFIHATVAAFIGEDVLA